MRTTVLLAAALMSFQVWAKDFTGTADIEVQGMTCGSCAESIEGHFKKLPDVESVSVSFETKKMHLKLKPGKSMSEAQVGEQLHAVGYELKR